MKFSFIFFFIYLNAAAQLPTDCNLFYTHTSPITTYNPKTLTILSNTIATSISAGGLAVNRNLNTTSPATTFYTTDGGYYYYYNETTWINTGHACSNSLAANLGGAELYIYNLAGSAGKVYKYDGTGNDVLILTLPTFNGPYDLIGDYQGNFYLLNTSAVMALQKYSPNGTLLCSYNLIGLPSAGGRGFAVVENKLYVTLVVGTYEGTIIGTSINCSPSTFVTSLPIPGDYASCAIQPLNLSVSSSGNLSCINLSSVLSATLTASAPTYSWAGSSIISGEFTNAVVINGTGIYTVSASSGLPCNEISTNTISITANNQIDMLIPNVFTPNGDNVNDLFNIKFNCLKEITLTILNRWGQKLYEQTGVTDIKWDGNCNGNKVSSGTYFYSISAIDYNDNVIKKNGFLSLLN